MLKAKLNTIVLIKNFNAGASSEKPKRVNLKYM